MDSFRRDLQASRLCKEFETMDLSAVVDSYNTELYDLLDKHAPIVSKTVRHSARDPWYDSSIHDPRKRSRVAERKYRKSESQQTYAEFRVCEEQYHRELRSAKTRNYTDIVDSNARNQRQLFRNLNKIMRREKKNPLPDYKDA